MRVTCPNCAAGYEVPDHLLAAGPRTLRCARCGTTFQAGIAVGSAAGITAGETPPPAPSPVEIPPPPMARPGFAEPAPLTFPRAPPMAAEPRVAAFTPTVAARYGRASGSGALLGVAGWLLTAVLLAAGLFEAVQQRSAIVAAWPASARLYDAVGLNPAAAAGPPRPAATPPVAAP